MRMKTRQSEPCAAGPRQGKLELWDAADLVRMRWRATYERMVWSRDAETAGRAPSRRTRTRRCGRARSGVIGSRHGRERLRAREVAEQGPTFAWIIARRGRADYGCRGGCWRLGADGSEPNPTPIPNLRSERHFSRDDVDSIGRDLSVEVLIGDALVAGATDATCPNRRIDSARRCRHSRPDEPDAVCG